MVKDRIAAFPPQCPFPRRSEPPSSRPMRGSLGLYNSARKPAHDWYIRFCPAYPYGPNADHATATSVAIGRICATVHDKSVIGTQVLAVGGLSTKTAAAAAAAAAARRNLRRPNHFRLSTGTHGRAAVALSLTLSQLITDDTRARRPAAAAAAAADKWSPTSV